MATEEILVNGEKVTTLKELLRPGLTAIFVGINPSLGSVQRGHYYQTTQGQHFWNQLRTYQIAPAKLQRGAEDDAMFELGFGFTDLVRLPTKSATDIGKREKRAAVSDLAARLSTTGDRPIVVFRYKEGWDLAHDHLEQIGYRRMLWMPCPRTPTQKAALLMATFQGVLKDGTGGVTTVQREHRD